ncbi:hypothetical protein [Variovorax sp. E3]|uniref:hypothetical protein n=1 Tax=Variovorax sp. E3 TaxID=1914993 RepID=UPI0018DEB337|nr:hypothetical protein [Variovorax sp. E3]
MRSGHPLAMKDSLDCQDFADQELLPGDPMWSSHGHGFIPKAGHGPEFTRRAFARCAYEV